MVAAFVVAIGFVVATGVGLGFGIAVEVAVAVAVAVEVAVEVEVADGVEVDTAAVSGSAPAVAEAEGTASVAEGTEGTGADTAALAGTSRAIVCRGRLASSNATRAPDSASSAITVNTAVSTLRRSPGGACRLRTCGSSLLAGGLSGGHRIASPAGSVGTCGGGTYPSVPCCAMRGVSTTPVLVGADRSTASGVVGVSCGIVPCGAVTGPSFTLSVICGELLGGLVDTGAVDALPSGCAALGASAFLRFFRLVAKEKASRGRLSGSFASAARTRLSSSLGMITKCDSAGAG